MSFTLTKPYPRLWSLEEGVAMVVTDLHGDWDAYQRYRDRFVDLQGKDQADCLIFTGDLIHAETPSADRSIEIILDLLDLKTAYGPAIICLCGNHELPHIYAISLTKGQRVYTPDFEAAMVESGHRPEIMALLDSLPFYVRTKAGVSLAHAGASPATLESKNALKLFNWDHQALWDWACKVVNGEDVDALRVAYANSSYGLTYDAIAHYFLAVSSSNDPRYDDLLRGFFASNHALFIRLLWPALFTRCEQEYSLADYAIFLDALLKELSIEAAPQKFLVAGHIPLKGSYRIIANRHLRLASAHHATPREAGRYLLFDTAQPIEDIKDLTSCLQSVFQ